MAASSKLISFSYTEHSITDDNIDVNDNDDDTIDNDYDGNDDSSIDLRNNGKHRSVPLKKENLQILFEIFRRLIFRKKIFSPGLKVSMALVVGSIVELELP